MTNRIAELRNKAGLSQQQLADAVGTSDQMISLLERGKRGLTQQWMERLAPPLGVSPVELISVKGGDFAPPRTRAGGLAESKTLYDAGPTIRIPEIDVRGGLGGGGEALVEYRPDGMGGNMATDALRAAWELPADYLRSFLGIRGEDSAIFETQGDSMEPTIQSGDRVMVHLRDRVPSPPGLFALWDGFGVVVKRLERILNTDPPRISITSDNPAHRAYELSVDEVNIIGRVKWFARRL